MHPNETEDLKYSQCGDFSQVAKSSPVSNWIVVEQQGFKSFKTEFCYRSWHLRKVVIAQVPVWGDLVRGHHNDNGCR